VAVNNNYVQYVLEQLAALGGITARKMFGGTGLYSEDLFFGLIDDDTLFFKVNDINRADYEARNMPQFRPFRDRPDVSLTYYQVPVDVLEDPSELAIWAQKSIAAAAAAPKRRKKK
jgi:DNA transformation protein and related proteins